MSMPFPTDELPILTETVDGAPLELPTLTEAVEACSAAIACPLSEEQCEELAERLFPRIEVTLLDAISATPDADWGTAMRKVRSDLPQLIRNAIQESL